LACDSLLRFTLGEAVSPRVYASLQRRPFAYLPLHTDFIQSFSLLDYSYYVAQVLGEIQQFMGFVPERILVTTDETDEEWL
jgi:hypothetical protein